MEELKLWGTIINVFAVLCGGGIGLLLKHFMCGKKQSERMERVSDSVLKGLALCVLAIGITGTIKAAVNDQILGALAGSYVASPDHPVQLVADLAGERSLVIILSMTIGALIGELLDLDQLVNRLGERIETRMHARFGNVAQGFVTASLLFCVGSMTIVGSLNSGLTNDHSLLYTKSTLDFVSGMTLASSLGIGVLFSVVFLFVFQGGITLFAQWIAPVLSTEVITCMSGVGSILIIALALNLLKMTKIKIMNYMPAILLPILLIPIADWLGTLL